MEAIVEPKRHGCYFPDGKRAYVTVWWAVDPGWT